MTSLLKAALLAVTPAAAPAAKPVEIERRRCQSETRVLLKVISGLCRCFLGLHNMGILPQ